MKPIFLIIILYFLTCSLPAQDRTSIKGIIFKKETSDRLSAVRIINKHTNDVSLSDIWGNFIIRATIGDTILFEKEGFQNFEKIILTKQNLIIYLGKVILLDEVVVKQQSKKKEQQEILAGF